MIPSNNHRPFSRQSFVSLPLALFVGILLVPDNSKAQEFNPGEIYNPYGVEIDRENLIRSVELREDEESEKVDITKIPRKNIYIDKETKPKEEKEPRPQRPEKISPVLLDWLSNEDPQKEVEVIITFQENMPIPRLPELAKGEKREQGGKRAQAIKELQKRRRASQGKLLKELSRYGKFSATEGFWLVNSVAGKTTLDQIKRLAEWKEVVYLQPVEGGEKPPADGNNNNDAEDGRARIKSDPYFNLSLTSPWIGLLDTGVRDTHVMFNGPDNLAWLRDCVNGGNSCNQIGNAGYNTTDFSWDHGTRSAGILTGNNRLGDEFRGVTEIRTDSWQIYTAGGLNTTAAVRGIQAGVAAFDKVLVGEIQANESDVGTLATAADNAYDAGVIFVSANGNFGPNTSTVRSPGIAHKVLGVGGFMTDGGAQYNNQGRGPANDGRFKPDIQAPTWSETARASSDTALGVYSGTSGATPYAAASAMLARNWLHRFGSYDNGQTYAFMILYGQNPWPYDNTQGAGKIKMATNGWASWGKVVSHDKMNIDIPINIGSGKQDFDAAIWWPESAAQQHNDVDIHLIDPYGVERAKGYSANSVFERARVGGALTPGQWKLRIRGYSVKTGAQIVYWATHFRR